MDDEAGLYRRPKTINKLTNLSSMSSEKIITTSTRLQTARPRYRKSISMIYQEQIPREHAYLATPRVLNTSRALSYKLYDTTKSANVPEKEINPHNRKNWAESYME